MTPVSGISVATLAVFLVLVHPISYCLWKHGKRGILGWMILQLFCIVRIVGSILQIQEAVSNSTSDTAALILSNVGLSPLLLGTFGVLHEARTARDPDLNTRREWRTVFAYHGAVVGSMVLVVIGVVHEISTNTTTPPAIIKVGVIGLLLCWVTFCWWTVLSLRQRSQDPMIVPAWVPATMLLYTVNAALPFLGSRVMYAVLSTFIQNPSFKNSTAAKVILSTIPEMIVILLMSVQGIRTRNIAALRKMKEGHHSPPSHHSLGLQLEHKNNTIATESAQ